VGLAQQRYVKSHRILANCRAVKDFRRFRNSSDRARLTGPLVHLVNHLTTVADLHRAGRYDRMSDKRHAKRLVLIY